MALSKCQEQILSEEYRDFIITDYRYKDTINYPVDKYCVADLGLRYRALYVDRSETGEITIEKYGYNAIPNCYSLLDLEPLNAAGVLTLQRMPSLGLTGEGIMIGIIDTGVDYRNPVFRDELGQSRILGLWDQTIQTGTPPEGVFYGTEYTKADLDEAIRSEDPMGIVPSKDEIGHGTYIASVAMGSPDIGQQFLGVASKASLGVVKLKRAKDYLRIFYGIKNDAICFQENDIMMGLKYLQELAEREGKPLVYCIALGSNFGGHNGSTLLSRMLGTYADILNRCVVIGSGNEANKRHHYYGQFQSIGEREEAEISVSRSAGNFALEMWTSLPNVITAYIVSPSGERSQTISLRQGSRYVLNFFLDGTTVEVEYRLLIENSNAQLIFMRFQNAAEGIWKIGVEPVYISEGDFHLWLPVQEWIEGDVFFLNSNPDATITEPGNTSNAITVSYYNSRENSVDINSGRGYTRDNILKPDFAVPGVEITGISLGRFMNKTGSSASVGFAAGACALIMQWLLKQPAIRGVTCSQVKNIIVIGTSQRDNMEYPNREWGYGTMDLYQSLIRLRNV